MCIFFFKQKTAYEMRISDWSSDVCSSDLAGAHGLLGVVGAAPEFGAAAVVADPRHLRLLVAVVVAGAAGGAGVAPGDAIAQGLIVRSEEPTSELQSLMRISYAVFCLKKKKIT